MAKHMWYSATTMEEEMRLEAENKSQISCVVARYIAHKQLESDYLTGKIAKGICQVQLLNNGLRLLSSTGKIVELPLKKLYADLVKLGSKNI